MRVLGETEDPSVLARNFGPKVDGPYDLQGRLLESVPHGTTIVAFRFADGVLIAGDRRATAGNIIASRRIEKVAPADRYSAVGFAGSAGPAMEMVKLFQVQLEHYEKVEGVTLSLEGKANQLSQMIRANMGLAMSGLVVVPLFVGWDLAQRRGRIFTYDITGGRYEEVDYYAIGSGGREAQGAVKYGFADGMNESEAFDLALTALFEAAQEDSATGGPDPLRSVYPTVATVTANGYRRVDDGLIAQISSSVVERRSQRGSRQ
jgi:proteasome beta subunit